MNKILCDQNLISYEAFPVDSKIIFFNPIPPIKTYMPEKRKAGNIFCLNGV